MMCEDGSKRSPQQGSVKDKNEIITVHRILFKLKIQNQAFGLQFQSVRMRDHITSE